MALHNELERHSIVLHARIEQQGVKNAAIMMKQFRHVNTQCNICATRHFSQMFSLIQFKWTCNCDLLSKQMQTTYQLSNAVYGSVVFITEAFHAFKAAKEKICEMLVNCQSQNCTTNGSCRSGSTCGGVHEILRDSRERQITGLRVHFRFFPHRQTPVCNLFVLYHSTLTSSSLCLSGPRVSPKSAEEPAQLGRQHSHTLEKLLL